MPEFQQSLGDVLEYAGEQIDRQDAEDLQQRAKLAVDGICTFFG